MDCKHAWQSVDWGTARGNAAATTHDVIGNMFPIRKARLQSLRGGSTGRDAERTLPPTEVEHG